MTGIALLALVLSGAGSLFFAVPALAQIDSLNLATPLDTLAPAPADTVEPAPSLGLPTESEFPDQEDRIRSIQVSGLNMVDTTLVLSTFPMRTGDIYRILSVREGIKALYRLQLFEQVEVSGERHPEGIDLFISVVESPRVEAVEFNGNDAVDNDKLMEKIAGTSGKVANGRTMNEVTTKLLEVYREEGFPLATVEGQYLPGTKENVRLLSLEIREGTKIQVTAIHFVGNESMPDDKLRGEMDTKTKSFWKKGHLRPEKLEEDLDKIRMYYLRNGYRDIRITDHKVTYGPDGKTAEITIALDEGPVYTMGDITVEGNTIFPTATLLSLVKFQPGFRYNRQKIDESAGEIGGVYADRGYLYAQVDPEERVDSTTVHVVYQIVEQEPSRVREIQISGNTRTKERVIRRQLYLYPGQKFDRSLLIRSQRELFQLGFFQDVQVDFRPLPNSYDVDLVLNVEEKAVGTASAGAGFSSQGGLTGFVELGHPNLFGNGQSVNLRLEKGSRTSNFEFSFTEPWFLDSPTTLGADIYRNTIVRDLYEVRRTGGALRASRPIPHVPYARMFGSYSYEYTNGIGRTVFNERPDSSRTIGGGTRVEQITYTPNPIQIDPSSQNSSSLTLGLSRNSTDHPVYPRAGMSTMFSNEFSGGVLQGDVIFHKHILDNRTYLAALNYPKSTKAAFLIRSQLGGIGFYGNEDAIRVPDSTLANQDDRLYTTEALELFRLGGTQAQALRGYDDYEVVPEENVQRRVAVRTESVYDSLGALVSTRTDSTYSYDTFPGGRYYMIFTLERQFTIVEPVHGVFFGEAGGVWNDLSDLSLASFHKSLGFGVRMEIPLLGMVGFDYAYGFDRLNRSRDPKFGGRYDKGAWQGHLHFGRFF